MSNREVYQPPTISSGASSSQQQQTGGGFNLTNQSFDGAGGSSVKYLCGDCDHAMELKKGDAIRCKECGYRVLYKQRTERMVQFEAR